MLTLVRKCFVQDSCDWERSAGCSPAVRTRVLQRCRGGGEDDSAGARLPAWLHQPRSRPTRALLMWRAGQSAPAPLEQISVSFRIIIISCIKVVKAAEISTVLHRVLKVLPARFTVCIKPSCRQKITQSAHAPSFLSLCPCI